LKFRRGGKVDADEAAQIDLATIYHLGDLHIIDRKPTKYLQQGQWLIRSLTKPTGDSQLITISIHGQGHRQFQYTKDFGYRNTLNSDQPLYRSIIDLIADNNGVDGTAMISVTGLASNQMQNYGNVMT